MTPKEKDTIRETIVEAASSMFGKFGYKKTTMDDIALASRKGKTAIYYYFKNKDDIFRAVIEKEALLLSTEIMKAVSIHTNPVEKLKAYILTRMIALRNVATFYDAMKNELLDQLNFINKTREEYDRAELEMVTAILTEGTQKGNFKVKHIGTVASTIVTSLKGLEIPFLIHTAPEELEEKVSDFIEIICFGIIKR
jgi:AcrR family transcriptional regulator